MSCWPSPPSLIGVIPPVSGPMTRRAHRYHRGLLDESRVTSDPALRAVFVEDAVSVSGDVITLAALALNQITGSSIPQGVAAVLIGLVLIRTSLRLVKRSHDFLVGAWPLTPAAAGGGDADGSATQPLTPADEQEYEPSSSPTPESPPFTKSWSPSSDRAGRGLSPALTLPITSALRRSSHWYAASSRV